MKNIAYLEIEGRSAGYYALLGLFGLLIAVGLGARLIMENHSTYITGMSNQIV